MKALLVAPHKLIPSSFSITLQASPPLGLAFVAGALEAEGVELKVLDCVALAPSNYFPFDTEGTIMVQGIGLDQLEQHLPEVADLVTMSCMFSNNWLINRKLAALLRAKFPKAVIVLGGEHASAIPEYNLKDCPAADAIVMGEGEETIAQLARAIRTHQPLSTVDGIAWRDGAEVRVNPKRNRIETLEAIPRPAWHHFPLDDYFGNNISYGIAYGKSLPIMATRGCPFSCTFCSSPQMWGTRYSMRSVEDVIDEIRHLNSAYGVTNIDFYDLTAIIRKEWILEFCAALRREGLEITWQIPAGTRSEAIDDEVAAALRDSGCKNITYAPESGSPRMLKLIKKKVKLDRMLHSISSSHRAGLNVKLNILLGYPDERLSDMLGTWVFLIKASWHGATDASPSIFSPYPGSELFEELCANGELTVDDAYFARMVNSQSLHNFRNYNRHHGRPFMIMALFISYLVFYGSNYLFRPVRALRLVRNVWRGSYATRGEYMLATILGRKEQMQRTKSSAMSPVSTLSLNNSEAYAQA